jgi:predicted Zn-dependent protease
MRHFLILALIASAALAQGPKQKTYENPEAFAWTRGILDRVAPRAGLDPAKVQLTLLDSDEVNAFADAKGNVSVTRGLLQTVEWDDELAAVIGHEIAHVKRKHVGTTQKQTVLANVAVGLLGAWTKNENLKTGAAVASNLTLLKYSRKQETDADDHGMKYMAEAGFSPRGMVGVMQKLGAKAKSSKLTAFLSSHPEPGSRVSHNQKGTAKYAPALVQQPMQLTFGGFRKVVVPLTEGATPVPAP